MHSAELAEEPEIRALEELLARGKRYKERFHMRLEADQRALTRFLHQYYGQLAPLFEKDESDPLVPEDSPAPLAFVNPATNKAEPVTAVYRKLVKQCHPDRIDSPFTQQQRHEWLQQINAAYAAGDTARLREWADWLEEKEVDYLEYLRRKQQALREELQQLRHSLQELHASPAWQLQQAVTRARLRGQDAFGLIRDHAVRRKQREQSCQPVFY